jgi:proton-dependent oligopeptide transporter, POT family
MTQEEQLKGSVSNVKLIGYFALILAGSYGLLRFVAGMGSSTPAENFKLWLFSSIIAFLLTVIIWILNQKQHPKGLFLLFFTEMWERFSYYGMRGILILYLTKTAQEGGLGIDKGNASVIYGLFTGFVYFTPIIGGWIADNFLGQRKSILIGGVLMMLGQFSLASNGGTSTAYLGFLLIIIGNGFFKPNISTLVGQLYPQGDARRDSAFTIFYMGINLGAFLAPLICGLFAEDLFATKELLPDGSQKVTHYSFGYGFLAAGIGMALGQIIFNSLAKKYLGEIGLHPAKKNTADLAAKEEANRPLTNVERDRMAVIFTITLFVTFFWAGFEQAGSSLSLYTDKYIDRTVFGWTIPTSYFQSVNPLFIVLLGAPIAALWLNLAKKGKDWSIPVKMALGMILLGIGFLFMLAAVKERGGDGVQDEAVKAGLIWLLGTYFFHTVGELCLSPVGLSMITKLAPVKFASMLMGVWFLSPFVAQIIGGFVAKYVEELGAGRVFGIITIFVMGAGVLLFFLSRKLVSWMHGRG